VPESVWEGTLRKNWLLLVKKLSKRRPNERLKSNRLVWLLS
jgi:hypothetical protein